ncbi:hypothetical protein Tco_0884669 [Tanacetum coccineum]
MNELPCSTQYSEANNLPRSEFIVTLLREINEIAFVVKPLSLSFDFVFASKIFKSLSFRLDCLCHLAILCLDQHAHTLHHLESLLTISLDRLDILKEDLLVYEHVVMNPTSVGMRHLHLYLYMNLEIKQLAIKSVDEYGFVIRPDLGFAAVLAVLVTGTSQSRQHGKSESDSYYLSDYVVNSFTGTSLIHIESRKSPTKSLFDVRSSRISIFIVNT